MSLLTLLIYQSDVLVRVNLQKKNNEAKVPERTQSYILSLWDQEKERQWTINQKRFEVKKKRLPQII